MTVKDDHGGQAKDTTTAIIANLPPIASFVVPYKVPVSPDTAFFDGSGSKDLDGKIVLYIWNFGDGSPPDSSGPKVWHVFQTPRTQQIRLTVIDNEGASDDTLSSVIVPVEQTDQENVIPDHFSLQQNYPNPFQQAQTSRSAGAVTYIKYGLPVPQQVRLKIYNGLGQKVRTLISGWQAAGIHTVGWNGRDDAGRPVANGIYFYSLEAKGVLLIRKMAIVR
ncbi:MAG: PKD domain-containing protein [Calditrichaeota bacterium]|nr:MAG: PKD domain-containing protein [Calditrichota bacterium]